MIFRSGIHAIAAVGNQGQLGFEDGLPWPRDPEDMKWFAAATKASDLCVVGHNTAKTLPVLSGRALVTDTKEAPLDLLKALSVELERQVVMIIGGAKTYARWTPYIKYWHITRIDYSGPADVWMPPLWQPGQ